MNYVSWILIIVLGTPLLAALIVAANWDLVVIQTWLAIVPPRETQEQDTWRPSRSQGTVRDFRSAGGYSASIDVKPAEPILIRSYDADQTEAEEWLAAAAAHRLAEYRRTDHRRPTEVTSEQPARPLREVLAARRADQVGSAVA